MNPTSPALNLTSPKVKLLRSSFASFSVLGFGRWSRTIESFGRRLVFMGFFWEMLLSFLEGSQRMFTRVLEESSGCLKAHGRTEDYLELSFALKGFSAFGGFHTDVFAVGFMLWT